MDTCRPHSGTLTKSGLVFLLLSLVAACSDSNEVDAIGGNAAQSSDYVVLDDDLKPLIGDFNATIGKVRLIFISGPTCAICLRGLADLQSELMSKISGDPRYEVFVVHVPTLGAEEENVIQSLPLLYGPNVHHYWDEPGTSGIWFQETMDVDFYVWDYWAIYDPNAHWVENTLTDSPPPFPSYWEHQLGSVWPRDKYLDAERFAQNVIDRGENIEFDDTLLADNAEQLSDGVELDVIFQGLGVAIPTYHNGRGGYQKLKTLVRIEWTGEISTPNGVTHPIKISRDRKLGYQRKVDGSVAFNDGESIEISDGERGLPRWAEEILLAAYEFDSVLTDWKDKQHKVEMSGMETLAGELNWMLTVRQQQGFDWKLLIDTHEGDINSARLLDDSGNVKLEIRELDHEEFDGWRFATHLQYLDGDGEILADEKITVKAITLDKKDSPSTAKVVH